MLALSTRPISQVIKRMSSFIPAGIIASLHSAHGLRYWGCCVFLLLAGCAEPWNNPYPAAQSGENILYNAFAERPKHLDPVQSYSTNEILFTAQIYQPPLQYHYLKRPFELIPQTATTLPTVRYYDANDVALPADAEEVAFSVYEIHIKPEIHYQPHPAFARDVLGDFLYHTQTASDLKQIQKIADCKHDDQP